MNEIICDKCAATFTPDMIEIQKRVITELADDIQARAKMLKEQYAEYTEE